jgi:hypothetical protein
MSAHIPEYITFICFLNLCVFSNNDTDNTNNNNNSNNYVAACRRFPPLWHFFLTNGNHHPLRLQVSDCTVSRIVFDVSVAVFCSDLLNVFLVWLQNFLNPLLPLRWLQLLPV